MIRNSTHKAIAVTALFAVFGWLGIRHLSAQNILQTHVIYQLAMYVLLLIHTFFSVQCFSKLIDPKDKQQIAIDALLVLAYFITGTSLWSSTWFWHAWLILFLFATLKYILLVGRLSQPRLLRRKLMADLGGVMLFFIHVFSVTYLPARNVFLMNLPWLLFAIASGYYLLFNPLYVPDEKV